MVDYSKWDALDVGADGDDDDAARRRGAPRVTRLEGPSRVTFGGPNLDRDEIVAEVRAPDPDARPPPDPPRRSSAIDYARFDRVAADVSSSDDEREYFEDDAWALKHGLRAPPSASNASKAVVGPRREYVGAMPPPSEPPPGYFPKTRGIGEPSPPPIGNARTVRLTGTTPATAAANAMANAQLANAANATGSSGDDATTAASKAASAFAARKEKFTLNGGEERESESSGGRYVWCQDEREATISAFAPAGAKAKDVVVKCTPTKISVTHMGHTLLDDEFAHPIDPEHRDRDDEINGHLDDYDACDNFEFGDWELCDYEPRGVGDERRCVRVTVRKKNLGMMTHWWRRATKRGDEIPVEALKTRKPGKGEESHRVWEEAQAMFKEKVAARRPPVMIDRETGEVVSPED